MNINGIYEERFSIVLTNPPFGQLVDMNDEIQNNQVEDDEDVINHYKNIYGDAYEKIIIRNKATVGKPILKLFSLPKSSSIKTELLFIERCLDLLIPGGKLGIVLPEGILNNSSLNYVREFVEERAFIRAIISLPQDTFASTGAKVKASVVFLQKFTNEEKQQWMELMSRYNEKEIEKQKDERHYIENKLIQKITIKEKMI